ncbi:MAG: hypothetical protein RLY93_05820 [Sumerlaeia bacterium]
MQTINERKSALIAALQTLLPGWQVRPAMGDLDADKRFGLGHAPEIQVAAGGWKPPASDRGQGGGTDRWLVRVASGDVQGVDDRLWGADGVLPAADVIRQGLTGLQLATGHSPLLPAGGKLLNAGLPAVWEEVFEEARPLAGLIRAAFGEGLELLNLTGGAVARGATTLPDFGAEVGDLVGLYDLSGGAMEFLGEVLAKDAGTLTVERPTGQAFSALAQGLRFVHPTRLPTGPALRGATRREAATRQDYTLSGASIRTVLAPARQDLDLTFSPLTAAMADPLRAAWDALLDQPEIVWADGAGVFHRAAPRAAAEVFGLGHNLAGVRLEMTLLGTPEVTP